MAAFVPPLAPRSLHISSPRTPLHRSWYHSPSLSLHHQHQHQDRYRHRHLRLLSLPNSLSFISATSDGSSISALLPPSPSRSARRANARSAAVIRAAFIFEWISRIFKFFTATPTKLFVYRLEADLNKAAKLVKTGATVVIHIAKEVDEIADEVEHFAEQVETFAEKVVMTVDTVQEQADDLFDVIEGEKKVVITGYKLVDNKEVPGVNEIADEVERFSEKVETFAEKIVATVDTVQEKADDVLDVIDGKKKVVITGYKLVDNKEVTARAVANISTATENKTTVSVETSIKDVSPEKSNNH